MGGLPRVEPSLLAARDGCGGGGGGDEAEDRGRMSNVPFTSSSSQFCRGEKEACSQQPPSPLTLSSSSINLTPSSYQLVHLQEGLLSSTLLRRARVKAVTGRGNTGVVLLVGRYLDEPTSLALGHLKDLSLDVWWDGVASNATGR